MKTLLICLFSVLPLAAKEAPTTLLTATAAEQFLVTLDEGQRAKAAMPFASDQRENYHFTPQENRTGLRVLAAEEDLSRTLVNTLIADGRSAVIFSDKAPNETFTAENRHAVWRDMDGDFGHDILAEHLQQEH